jgi:hypothetical protein
MWNVISPRICRESAESLGAYMNINYPIEHDMKVNWGNSSYSINNPLYVYGNKAEAVGRSANKQLFFDICKGQGTVPVISYEVFTERCYQHFDANGHNGSGIKFVANEEDFTPSLLTTKEIQGEEYRVYFCYDMEPQIYLKAPLSDDVSPSAIRNSSNGYGYMANPPKLKRIKDLKHYLLTLTKEVSERMELSYGAVDFIVDSNYTIWVLETNSAPTLFNEALLEGFAEQFYRRWSC